ncbi:MAG: phosphoribosylanthranilate isomerase [Paracoccaceae bacterium]
MVLHGETRVKMCGMTTPEQAEWASAAGAAYVGLVFFPPSPRYVTPEAAREISMAVPPGVAKVALLVDPDDTLVDAVASLPIDILQLQGAETPDRVKTVRDRTGLPIIKAIGLSTAEDLSGVARYANVVDQMLIDAKPPAGGKLPGGNGLSFDWTLVAGRRWPTPWMLAGGLTADNVGEAIRRTGALQVDLSSGIESAPGVKDKGKINKFMDAVRAA